MSMKDRTIVQGETYAIPFSLVDQDGSAIDMTVGTRSLTMRIRIITSTSVTDTKSSGTAADLTWTTQASGTGSWTFTSTETAALTAGFYAVDVLYQDTATSPTTKHIVGEATYEVVAPVVSTL